MSNWADTDEEDDFEDDIGPLPQSWVRCAKEHSNKALFCLVICIAPVFVETQLRLWSAGSSPPHLSMALLNIKRKTALIAMRCGHQTLMPKQLFTIYLASMVIRAVYGCRLLVSRRYIRHSDWSRLGTMMMNQTMKMMSRQQVRECCMQALAVSPIILAADMTEVLQCRGW